MWLLLAPSLCAVRIIRTNILKQGHGGGESPSAERAIGDSSEVHEGGDDGAPVGKPARDGGGSPSAKTAKTMTCRVPPHVARYYLVVEKQEYDESRNVVLCRNGYRALKDSVDIALSRSCWYRCCRL